ncbi:MAG: Beta-ketoacyl-ACP reductase [Anaerolineales bacterium]|jgi:NAD(P)-dependent dehydrogenase (short-subunit alcohol dehydrogenase family)|nr:Beta-ketoacyl-ACP reductase [Anaerolineales bacterium]
MRLKDKVALITGGAGGIGRATALRFAREGAGVVVADMDEAGVNETARLVADAGGKAIAAAGSVTARADVQRMVDAATSNFGRLDILINNAGINKDALAVRVKDGDVKMMTDDQWDAVMNVNLKGTFVCSQIAAVPMMAQKFGRIVNTSSIGALGNIGQANYSASKAGVIGLTKTLALEWARYNISVNCVAPGATKTRMTAGIPDNLMAGLLDKIPFRRMAEPDEIAAAHLFFASDDASYVTGQVLFVDGGISVGV